MAGKKGMTAARPQQNTCRRRMWQSMRILRRFQLPDLCRTAEAKYCNARKFVQALETHGYVARCGSYVKGIRGVYQTFRLVRDIGPDYPVRCERCGRPIAQPCEPLADETGGDG